MSQGRPRSESASRAILAATLDLIAEHGATGAVTVEAVAARSGASKATIYRRWSSREELIAAAVESIKSPPVHDLPHESLRDDLVRLGRAIRTDVSSKERRVLKCIMVESDTNPELRQQQERLMARRREATIEVFAHWQREGVLAADVDPQLAAAMLVSPILTIMVYGHYPSLRSDHLVEQVVDQLVAGLTGAG
ncbi:TetR/AcrR family transcriptional regulator [Nocardioides panacisoli]|uniref:TetR/AcrR family transcriptional regulator n=1 Tax=Nocardioides panacisoli TaxID=627624 RepID=UPI001C627343|nr:TetR/AcrR family transcriptional regulator [Nocardioides panacisoli]QYJ02710.1 TetR/AcrR family transcriptional regulator [Nocardioides panacisoli]